MPKYDFIYTVCNGAFMMDICTGYCIFAESRKKAMQAAGRLDSILSESFDLRCYFDLKPKPHITVQGTDRIHQKETQPVIINFQVQQNFDSPQKLLGYPVFTDDDFQNLSEADFIKEMIEKCSGYMNFKHRTCLKFDCISYGVMDQESK